MSPMGQRLAGLAVPSQLNLHLAGLGVLSPGHRDQEYAVLVHRLDLGRINGRAQPKRSTEARRRKLLPDRLGTLRDFELELALDRQGLVVHADVNALLIQAWRQQSRLVAL